MALEKDEQAMILFTNRLLLDWISLAVDGGRMPRDLAERLIDFSATEVIRGALWLEEETRGFAELTKSRMPPGKDKAEAELER